ncbi:esterase/lipase family protein [Inhella gelatinilytica]|uniref:Alpha/beta hydrolase n=1 Tax=Inhella gelatinilytica TaxID=2795030 RepID=A0A931IWI3_9BURK|nr:alpha/beta hydrolase [Inhella gelatinilytica]MBH9553197.1 alpha/beta hydrolase [Inhella gelatinilytica]
MPQPAGSNDFTGAVRLATQGSLALIRLVEAMHARIQSVPGLPAPTAERTGGVTGLVYRTVRGVTHLVGGSTEALLGLLPEAVARGPRSPRHDAVVAALNGVLGDHLEATHNPLAQPMQLCSAGQPLTLSRAALAARFPEPSAGVLVLVHGLCMNDRQWHRKGHDHGEHLAAALGLTPLYLRYNTGLPLMENGQRFARLMATLLKHWPHRQARVVLVTHSMGGLVARSAFHAAAGAAWTRRVSDLVFLGTPHLGSPLEKAGHGVDQLLDAAPYAAPLARLGRLRSAGITDLRHGLPPEVGLPPTPPKGPECWTIAGALGAAPATLQPRLLGDGLVRLPSALGQHRDPARRLPFAADHQWVAPGVGHLDLLSSRAVARQLVDWLA